MYKVRVSISRSTLNQLGLRILKTPDPFPIIWSIFFFFFLSSISQHQEHPRTKNPRAKFHHFFFFFIFQSQGKLKSSLFSWISCLIHALYAQIPGFHVHAFYWGLVRYFEGFLLGNWGNTKVVFPTICIVCKIWSLY